MKLNIKKKIGTNQRINTNFILLNKKSIINNISKKILTGVELKTRTTQNIDFICKLRIYRGFRHKNKLPVRGQRTRTNAKTSRKNFQ